MCKINFAQFCSKLAAPPIWIKFVQNSIRDRDRDRSDKSRDWDVHFGSLLFKDLSYLRPCLKLSLPRRCFVAPAAPRACNATCPVRVHCSLRSHLLYWNTTRDQSEGLFRGLTSNPKYTSLSKVGPPQSECMPCFALTFSIGTPRATSPRGCFEGLVRTLICWRGPKLDLPSPSASLASLAPSLLEHHARPVRGVVSRA